MATFRKRGTRYEAQVRRAGFPTKTKSFLRLSDAKAWARLIETSVDRKELSPDRSALKTLTLADLIVRYRDTVLPDRKGGKTEAGMLNAFLKYPICRKTLNDLSTSDFAAWRDLKLKSHAGSGAITPKSVRRLLSPIQHMLTLAIEEWAIPLSKNPLKNFRLRVVDNKRNRRLPSEELGQLLRAAEKTQNPYVTPIILFALETGMRRGEILALRWSHFSADKRSLTIPLAKNGHSRTIPLTRKAGLIIQALEARDDLVFPTTANALKMAWNRLVARAGLENLHFHDLRHEAISRFFELGLTVPEVASVSGHRDVRMLLRYAHADYDKLKAKLD